MVPSRKPEVCLLIANQQCLRAGCRLPAKANHRLGRYVDVKKVLQKLIESMVGVTNNENLEIGEGVDELGK